MRDVAKVFSPGRSDGVRCPTCNARLADALNGTCRYWCRGCKAERLLTRHDPIPSQEAPNGRLICTA